MPREWINGGPLCLLGYDVCVVGSLNGLTAVYERVFLSLMHCPASRGSTQGVPLSMGVQVLSEYKEGCVN